MKKHFSFLFLSFFFAASCGGSTSGTGDFCKDVDCGGHGTCTVDPGGQALCRCEAGYHAEDFVHCVPDGQADPCAGIDCGGIDCGGAVSCDDGNACTADTCDSLLGCQHAPLPVWYRDNDGDGYGAGTGMCAASLPPGYSAFNTDCCDMLSYVYPNNSNYYNSGYNCGGIVLLFDYNCDQHNELQYPQFENCAAQTTPSSCNAASGWSHNLLQIPGCGQTGQYVACSWMGSFCTAGAASVATQSCR